MDLVTNRKPVMLVDFPFCSFCRTHDVSSRTPLMGPGRATGRLYFEVMPARKSSGNKAHTASFPSVRERRRNSSIVPKATGTL